MPPPAFTPAHASALRWRYGTGASVVLPSGSSVPESGVVGTGNSAHAPHEPNPQAYVRFGAVERALHACGEAHASLLAVVYGAPGDFATAAGMYPSRLWRAAAPFTAAAREGAAAHERRRARKDKPATPAEPASQVAYEHDTRHDTPAEPLWKGDAGPVVLRWLSALFDPDAAKKDLVGAGDRAYLAQIEEQAKAQIEAAEEAFAAVYTTTPDWCTRREDR